MTQPPSVSIGDEVFFVLAEGPNVGVQRPAKVVDVEAPDVLSLCVFTNGLLDGTPYSTGIYWAPAVLYSAEHERGTWDILLRNES